MKNLKTKSILVCAVLASVLGGGVPVYAEGETPAPAVQHRYQLQYVSTWSSGDVPYGHIVQKNAEGQWCLYKIVTGKDADGNPTPWGLVGRGLSTGTGVTLQYNWDTNGLTQVDSGTGDITVVYDGINVVYERKISIDNSVTAYVGANGTSEGGALRNSGDASGTDITADFIGNYASGNTVFGGAIYNATNASIGNITGDFIGNYASSSDSAKGGAIYNYANGTIGNITGDFIANYVSSPSQGRYAYGGAIYNYDNAQIGNITGDFIGNYASGSGDARGGAIYNNGTISILAEDRDVLFSGNRVSAPVSANAQGGAIYNESSGTVNLYAAAGHSITFAGDASDDNTDSIYNDGTLNINGTENNYTGTVNLAKVEGTDIMNINYGTMNINGGRVNVRGTIAQKTLTINGNSSLCFTLPVNVTDDIVMIDVTDAVSLSGVTVNVYLNGQSPNTITLISNVTNPATSYPVYNGISGTEANDDYAVKVENSALILKSLQSVWYTVGDTEYKYLNSAGVQPISDTSGKAVVLHRGAGTANEYTGIDITGALTVGAETETGKSFLVSGALTANGGVTVATKNTLNVAAGNLKSDVTNNGTVNLGEGTLATGSTITGGTLNITGDVTANADDIAGNTNTVAENKTLTFNGGAVGGDISGAGSVVIAGNVTSDKNIANAVVITADTGELTVNGGNITGTVENNKTLNVAGGALKNDITNKGTMNVTGVASLQSDINNTNGTVNLNADGTLATGSTITDGTLNINGDVTANADDIAGSINAVAENKTLTFNGGTVAQIISGKGNVAIGDGTNAASVTADLAKLANEGTLAVNTKETLNLTAGSLAKAITNSGTVNMQGTSSFGEGGKINGGDAVIGSEVHFKSSNLENVVNFTADGAVYDFSAALGGDTPGVDKIAVTGSATGTLKLGVVTLTSEPTEEKWAVGSDKELQYLSGGTSNSLNVTNETVATSNGYKYTFSQAKDGDNDKVGYLNINRDYGYTLSQIVQNYHDEANNYDAGNVDTYVLLDNYYVGEEIGTLTRVKTGIARTFTIEGNNYTFGTICYAGFVVNSGDTLNVRNVSVIADVGGQGDYFVDNAGTVNIVGTTRLTSQVKGNGTTNIGDGSTPTAVTMGEYYGKIVQDNLNITANASLTSNADVLVIANGITNDGTVNLGAGTLATGSTITGGTLNITGDVTANAALSVENMNVEQEATLTISADNLQITNGLINTGKTILTGGTLSCNITTTKQTGSELEIEGEVLNNAEITQSGIRIKGSGTSFTTDADKIHTSQVDMLDNAVLNLTGGTIDFAVTNEQNTTAKIVEKATVGMSSSGHVGNLQVDGTLNMNGQTNRVTNLNLTATGTLNLRNDDYETVVFENLTVEKDATVNFDAKFTADGDKISAETGSGELALGSIGVKDDFDGNAGSTTTITFLTDGAASITLTGSAETVFGAYKYIFEPGTTAGTLKVTKDIGYSLVDIINDRVDNHVAGQVSNYSLNGDKTMDADMGTLTRPDSKVAREFTINGNNNKLLGGNKAGITVETGDTLTYKDIAEVSGFNGAAVINNGTFNANNVTFKNEIAGSGTMNVDGTVNADAKVTNKMNVAGTGTLNIAADNLKNAVTNNGTVNLGAGTLATGNTVTGGTLNINDDVTANASDIAGETNTIAANKTLTLSGGNLAQNISGGKVVVQGNVTTMADYLNREYEIAADKKLTVNAGILQYSNLNITGSGKLAVDDEAVLQATTEIFEVKDAKQDSALSITADKIAFAGGILSITGVISYSLDYYNSITALLKEQGNTSLQMSGAITVQEGENVINGILSGGVTVAEGASLRVSEINVTENAKMSGKIITENLISTEGKIITVGNDIAAGHVSATTIQLSDSDSDSIGMLFLDPAWKDGENLIEDATHVATANTTNLDGAYVVGRNSVLTFGATNDDADAVFGETGFTWGNQSGNITAAAYVAKTVNLVAEKGSLTVDGNLEVAPTGTDVPKVGTVNLAANSLLMVNTRNLTDNTAITGVSILNTPEETGKKATIYLRGARTGQDIYITDAGAGEEDLTNLTLAGLGANFEATPSIEGGKLKVHIDKGSLAILDETVMPNVGNALETNGNEDAAAFLDKVSMMTDDVSAIQAVNSVANLGENLGVSRGAYDVANMVGDAIDNHWDDNRVQDSGVRIQEKRKVWAVGTRNKETVDGVELGGMEAQYDAQYNGAVVGVNLSGNFGMAINYTDGKVNNKLGGHNDAEYYGGSLYAKTDWGNLRITVDATYTYGKNELRQNGITADAKTETISGGLTLKYMAKAGLNKIGPFAGIRYMHIKGRDYTDSLGVNREADTINSMVVPVGLEYTAEFKMPKSEWTWKPVLMAGYFFNLGDRTNDMFLSYNNAMDSFAYDFVDKGAFFAKAGMAFEKKNFSLGISYDFMKSKNSKNRRWNVNADVAF